MAKPKFLIYSPVWVRGIPVHSYLIFSAYLQCSILTMDSSLPGFIYIIIHSPKPNPVRSCIQNCSLALFTSLNCFIFPVIIAKLQANNIIAFIYNLSTTSTPLLLTSFATNTILISMYLLVAWLLIRFGQLFLRQICSSCISISIFVRS